MPVVVGVLAYGSVTESCQRGEKALRARGQAVVALVDAILGETVSEARRTRAHMSV